MRCEDCIHDKICKDKETFNIVKKDIGDTYNKPDFYKIDVSCNNFYRHVSTRSLTGTFTDMGGH